MEWILIIVGLLIADIVAHLIYARIILPIFETKPPFRVEPAAPDPQAEQISFPTSHGLTLRGAIFRSDDRPSRGLILFCPEVEANHWSAPQYCQGLLQAGFDVIAFDFRNQGESDHMQGYSPLHWPTNYEVNDILSAIRFVEGRGDLRHLPLALFGVSRGGAASLAAAAKSNHVNRVATDGAFSTESVMRHFTRRWRTLYLPAWAFKIIPEWHVGLTLSLVRGASGHRRGCRYTNVERLLPRLRNKGVLIMSGQLDTYVVPEISAGLHRRTGSEDGGLWIIPNAKHNEGRSVMPVEYDRCLVQFFDEMVVEDAPRESLVREPLSETRI